MQSKTVIFDEDKISPESLQSFKEEDYIARKKALEDKDLKKSDTYK